MGKLEAFVKDLTRYELECLVKVAKKELTGRRSFTIKHLLKKCGKAECMCAYESYMAHGPYAYAIYVNKDTGKQEQKSLGRVLCSEDFEALRQEEGPDWYDYRVSERRLKSIDKAEHYKKEWYERELNPTNFENYYGVSMNEDTLSRPRMITIDYKKYHREFTMWEDRREIGGSKWQTQGVGTLKGIRLLDALEEQGYYFRDK